VWHEQTWMPLQEQLERTWISSGTSFWRSSRAVVERHGELVRIGKAVNDSLLPILESRIKKQKLLQIEEELRDLKAQMKLAGSGGEIVEGQRRNCFPQLLTRIRASTVKAYERLLELKSQQADLDLRQNFAGETGERSAGVGAGAIRNRTGAHGRGEPPRDPAAA